MDNIQHRVNDLHVCGGFVEDLTDGLQHTNLSLRMVKLEKVSSVRVFTPCKKKMEKARGAVYEIGLKDWKNSPEEDFADRLLFLFCQLV